MTLSDESSKKAQLYLRLKGDILYNGLTTMFIESYLAICISCLIAFNKVSFNSAAEIFQFIFALILFSVIIVVPTFLIYFVVKYRKDE
jgi:heme/copper-type cytochrome/quinol oxidase subunit 2